ncbi:MAG: hypothetical protein V4501_01505 [Pseudomonadota bacterium]
MLSGGEKRTLGFCAGFVLGTLISFLEFVIITVEVNMYKKELDEYNMLYLAPLTIAASTIAGTIIAELVDWSQPDGSYGIQKANTALLAHIDALLAKPENYNLLTASEIKSYEEYIAHCEGTEEQDKLNEYLDNISCSINLEPTSNPIKISGYYPNVKSLTVTEVLPEAEMPYIVRFWITTIDADTLKTFVKRCNEDGKFAFAPEVPSDRLTDREHVMIERGFSKATVVTAFLEEARAKIAGQNKIISQKSRESSFAYSITQFFPKQPAKTHQTISPHLPALR